MQFKVLNKILHFYPMPGYYNKKEIKTDIKNFERKIKLKSFFELENQINLTKTMVHLQIILISNLKKPGNLLKITTSLTCSYKNLITIYMNYLNTIKLYHIITSHNMKRTL